MDIIYTGGKQTMDLIQIKTTKQAKAITGGLSATGKMPCASYSLSATQCPVGSKLAKIEGSVCFGCYALKGNYHYPSVKQSHKTKLEAITHTDWVAGMVYQITKEGNKHFRWHDSGDIQNMAHLEKIVDIARRMPDVAFWLPTKEYATVSKWRKANGSFPSNLTVRLSAYFIDGKAPLVYGLPVSTVSTKGATLPVGAVACPAYKQGGQCLDCRNCWNAEVQHVDYPKH